MKQTKFFKAESKSYGGTLRTKRKNRGARPIATKNAMHLVLRSTKAKGKWSFLLKRKQVRSVIDKFAGRFGVKVISVANVGNHLHLLIRLTNRFTYKAFVRSVTGALAMLITGRRKGCGLKEGEKKFWDYRPFTRVVIGYRALLTTHDYLMINQLEGQGASRDFAGVLVEEFFRSG